eukprot:g17344.t1
MFCLEELYSKFAPASEPRSRVLVGQLASSSSNHSHTSAFPSRGVEHWAFVCFCVWNEEKKLWVGDCESVNIDHVNTGEPHAMEKTVQYFKWHGYEIYIQAEFYYKPKENYETLFFEGAESSDAEPLTLFQTEDESVAVFDPQLGVWMPGEAYIEMKKDPKEEEQPAPKSKSKKKAKKAKKGVASR